MPEKEWPTSTVGPGCAAIARRAASDASRSDVRGFCTLVQLTPFGWRRAMTFDQQEPSANSPCTNTTFLVFGDVWALATRLSRGRAALAAAAPINVRRFMTVSYRATGILRRSVTGKPRTTIADDMREEHRRLAWTADISCRGSEAGLNQY